MRPFDATRLPTVACGDNVTPSRIASQTTAHLIMPLGPGMMKLTFFGGARTLEGDNLETGKWLTTS